MELKDLITLSPRDIDEDNQDEIFDILNKANADEVPKRNLRKILEICLLVLNLKGEQVTALQEQIETTTQDDGHDESIDGKVIEENEKLKRAITKLEAERMTHKVKLKEMTDEILSLQKRMHEMNAHESDKDSTDPLSELDRYEDLMKNISTKNKHIKRLLNDIEGLQMQNIEQSKAIIELERKLQQAKEEIGDINAQLASSQKQNEELHVNIKRLEEEITRLESNVTYLEDERERAEQELKVFIEKLEERAYAWRNTIDEKENQLESLRKKYEELYLQSPTGAVDYNKESEMKKLVEVLQEKDGIIEELESKLRNMAEEMVASTKLMNTLSAEREAAKDQSSKKSRICCAEVQEALLSANSRCKELSEMLETVEEDNMLKSKQAFDAANTLNAYEKGEDGLPQALRKISQLEQKLNSRDKQIKALVMEVNSLHEISQENLILRKKLNIPEDAILSTTNLAAKQRSKDKMIDRLTLKLRASEDMRLELKIEKNELKKRLGELQAKLASIEKQESVLKYEEKEEEDGPVMARADVYCDSCLRNIQTLPDKDSVLKDVVKEWEEKYASVIEENENLRVGMHEILEKIREYDASSDHITIDCSILAKLLHALDARSISGWYHPAMRMQNELIAVREREQALREKINLVEKAAQTKDSGTPKKIEIVRELQEITEEDVEIDEDEKSQNEVISTDHDTFIVDEPVPPIEGNMLQSEDLYPIIVEKEAESASARTQLLTTTEKYRDLQLKVEKLKCFEVQFQEIVEKMNGSESEITKYCSTLVERASEQEIQLKIQEKKYDFMKEDFDRVLTDYKNSESTNIMIIADLKKQINDKKHELNLEKTTDPNKSKTLKQDERDIVDIQKEVFRAKAQVAFIVQKLFSGNIPEFCVELESKTEGIMDYGLITDNLQVDYITADEYDRIKIEQKKLINNCNDTKLKCKQLEELLTIAQDQIKSQQKLISEITDNHIELRHLVADLQSKSEDKFLISKAHRDLETYKREMAKLKDDKEKLEDEHFKLKTRLVEIEKENHKTVKENAETFKNNDLKLRFLKKSVNILRENYCKFTPLILLADFVSSYSIYMKKSKTEDVSEFLNKIDDFTISKLSASKDELKSEDLVNLVKYETKCNFLEQQLMDCNRRNETLHAELDQCKLSIVKESEHWKTIQALFGDNKKQELDSKSSQTITEYSDASTNTEEPENESEQLPVAAPRKTLQESPTRSSSESPVKVTETKSNNITYLENQLEKAMELASTRGALLLETENRLAESKVKIKEMENIIEAKSGMLREQMDKTSNAEEKAFQRSTGIIESTIASLQSLLTEKDNTLTHYQELLKAEREQYSRACDNYDKELILIKKTNTDLEEQLKSKETNILELKSNLETLSKTRKSSKDELSLDEDLGKLDIGDILEISDEKIEEMFMDESRLLKSEILSETPPSQLDESVNRLVLQLQHHLKEAKNREIFWEKSIRAKDEEIALLKEKLTLLHEREKAESLNNPEIEQLRILLEEKDKHISDLMETLTSFHDDQQRFINETSLYSADQVSQLGADLTRLENTNKILNTQIEALRRQATSLTQREKQARDLANSLKTQLIKRPVVSIKTELNSRTKMEQLQKRITQLEIELSEARKEIKQQQNVIDAKRAKNASEVSLWEKQKRWQQNAEKLKTKLEETETALQKTRSLLNAAKNTISRLEKDKQIKELKSKDTPDSYSAGSESNSPTKKHYMNHTYNRASLDFSECNKEIIGALKARIESQQRKIVALELEGKGSNALVSELERLQEKVTALEAQSIRLEARNLQLQLDNDLVRQGDEVDRLQKRIKHLEDYIIALKEELAQAEAQSVRASSDSKSSNSNPEQTILALKRIIERLRVENKNLKEGRRGSDHRVKEYQDKTQASEISRLQHLYAESLDKISALQIELQLKSGCCSMCREKTASSLDGGGDLMNELKMVKEQLVKKTQLLEKAKILLTRAAAKEKNLKEQIALWKRKCSELQNVPVIDEISE